MEATKSFNSPEVKLHFLDYWRIIRIRKTVILAVFLLVTITTTLVTFILPKSYASTVRIAVDKNSQGGGLDGQKSSSTFDPYWIQTEFEKIQSKTMLHVVITNLGLNHRWAVRLKEESDFKTDMTYRMLKSQIDVRQSRNTSLIEIRAFSEIPGEAAEIANEIAKVYRQYRIDLRSGKSKEGIATLQAELDKQERRFQEKQTEVDKLKEELSITDIEGQGSGPGLTLEPEVLRRLKALSIEAQAEYEAMNTLYTKLKSLSRVALKRALATAYPDSQLMNLSENLAVKEQSLAEMVETLSPEHPDVKRLRRSYEQAKTQVNDRIDGILEGLEVRTVSQKAKLDQLKASVEEAKTNDIAQAIKRRPYNLKKRDLESLQLVRERLGIRIIQEQVDLAIPDAGIVEILDGAEPSFKAVRPNIPLNIALGVIVGLAVGVGLAFFIEYLDTSVKTIDDVERALQAPVLGVIPQNVGTLITEGLDSPHAEAYRVLRTNIMFSQKDPKLNTLTIVSGGAGEGKSTTIFNLATVFAQNGQRVLIVDSDLRRPSLHKLLKVTNSIGLTNYLLKQNTLEEVIQTTPLATLDFLPSGKLPSSSMGVLSSAQMKELIRELKRRYDYVFFDSPPIMGVSDASILASEVDMVLQVIQYRRYPQPMTIRAKQMIEKVGGNLLGIVLNNISMASDENYYYYSGYYYDYYSKQDDDEPEGKSDGAKKKSISGQEKIEIKPKY